MLLLPATFADELCRENSTVAASLLIRMIAHLATCAMLMHQVCTPDAQNEFDIHAIPAFTFAMLRHLPKCEYTRYRIHILRAQKRVWCFLRTVYVGILPSLRHASFFFCLFIRLDTMTSIDILEHTISSIGLLRLIGQSSLPRSFLRFVKCGRPSGRWGRNGR